MKIRFKYIALVGILIGLMGFAPLVFAVEDSTNQQTEGETPKTTLQERIENAKNEFRIKLSASEILALKGKCGSAQTKVKTFQDRVNANVPARVKAYQNLHDHLSRLVERLKDKGIDTATLESELTILDQKIQTFKDDLATYKQSLSDLKDINCQTDPDGFKSALEVARANRQKLTDDIADIKTYVKDTIKPTLMQIRDQLKATETNE